MKFVVIRYKKKTAGNGGWGVALLTANTPLVMPEDIEKVKYLSAEMSAFWAEKSVC